MAGIVITPQYRLVLARWQAGAITVRQVELFVKTNWLTRDQADQIYEYPRRQTDLVANDPFTPDTLKLIQEAINGNQSSESRE